MADVVAFDVEARVAVAADAASGAVVGDAVDLVGVVEEAADSRADVVADAGVADGVAVAPPPTSLPLPPPPST